ncbi:hypothetical protein Acsp02_95420 [Actinoplanes sp. NBRC 103695]|nr:hypothetical protein Acsp02_95420 [Actinoplanes sp. NBRC 103695]
MTAGSRAAVQSQVGGADGAGGFPGFTATVVKDNYRAARGEAIAVGRPPATLQSGLPPLRALL